MSVVKSTEFIVSFNSVLGIFNISQKYFASVVLKEEKKSNLYKGECKVTIMHRYLEATNL